MTCRTLTFLCLVDREVAISVHFSLSTSAVYVISTEYWPSTTKSLLTYTCAWLFSLKLAFPYFILELYFQLHFGFTISASFVTYVDCLCKVPHITHFLPPHMSIPVGNWQTTYRTDWYVHSMVLGELGLTHTNIYIIKCTTKKERFYLIFIWVF